jgi:hypothetical protein
MTIDFILIKLIYFPLNNAPILYRPETKERGKPGLKLI